MERISYQIEDRDAVLAEVAASGRTYNDFTLSPDGNGRYTNCYLEVFDVTPVEPDEPEDDPLEIIDILTGEVE